MNTSTELPVRIEIIPGSNIVARLRQCVPDDSTITVTCLPHHGPAETVRQSVELAERGYRAVPHLAARSIESRQQLREFTQRLSEAGVKDIFVIAGDARTPVGPYAWSLPLMEEIAGLGLFELGVAAYPEGHPSVQEPELTQLLLKKQELAGWAVTQMCFSGPVLGEYLDRLRSDGVTLPVWAGIPGRVRRTRLVSLAGRIGVGPSLKFAQRSGSLLRNVLAPSSYNPARLVRSIDEGGGFAGLHVYSFNDVERLGV
ncbi:methylenetetrahydrofolate reductase (NADPH) [Arthrobacter pigmenti]|uniref:Methylenetetrahydrofolate reductase n=1 Tax=Arthrobacter pigmenti TaxID=271432 RepID=A0A846S150_9MICC|nr:methylenetetrahydrofolate reductase [Arthrobacter pigmenti]NJC24161.1 methylenetetrahydrofolate reductase (NADPH) [Arthrobacter pigmenti]